MKEADRIVDALKDVLREQGVTYRELGRRLHLSEATIKRLFSQRTFTLARVQEVCDAIGVSLFDVTRRARGQAETEIYRLTVAQERKLVADVGLFYFFWMLIGRHRVDSICRRYGVPAHRAEKWLLQLDKLGILELREKGRFTLKVPSTVVWTEDGPIERLIVKRSLPHFLAGSFRNDDEYFRFLVAKLSPESAAVFRARLRELSEQILEQSITTDAMLPNSKTVGALVAFGPATFSLRDVVSR